MTSPVCLQVADTIEPPAFVIPDGYEGSPMLCLVTGANSGIGASVTEELVRQVRKISQIF